MREKPGGGLGWVLLAGAVVGVLLLGLAPTPYVIEQPGVAVDVLGEVELGDGDAAPLIEVADAHSYPSDGRLDLVTVRVLGTRDDPTSWIEVIPAWLSAEAAVVPIEAVYPEGQSSEEADQESAAQMEQSQQEAVAVALAEMGIPFDSDVKVASVLEGSPSDGLLEAGDVLLAIDGEPVTSSIRLRELIGHHGTDSALELRVRRDGAEQTVRITPVLADDGATPIIGVRASTVYEFPIDVEIQLENVGGPSAGLVFALGVYELLTPGSLTGGEHIAGTGAISADGGVGRVGGLLQKMHAARAAGAEWFILPAGNCPDARDAAPAGLRLVPVDSFEEAVAAVEAIGAGAQVSPSSCPVG